MELTVTDATEKLQEDGQDDGVADEDDAVDDMDASTSAVDESMDAADEAATDEAAADDAAADEAAADEAAADQLLSVAYTIMDPDAAKTNVGKGRKPMLGSVVISKFQTLKKCQEAVALLELKDKVKFVVQACTRSFGHEEWKSRIKGKDVMWDMKDGDSAGNCPIKFTGTPFMVLGRQTMTCSHGKSYHKKSSYQPSHAGKKTYMKLQKSKKLGCPAVLTVKELIYFPDFTITTDTKARRSAMSLELRSALRKTTKELKTRRSYVARFPGIDCHRNHSSDLMSTMRLPMDKRLHAKVRELVNAGIWHVSEVRQHLDYYVRMELFAGQTPPPPTDTRFWPIGRTILNSIYRARTFKNRNANRVEANATVDTAADQNGVTDSSKENEDSVEPEEERDELLRLTLPLEVLDLLPQVVENSVLHINAVNQRGNAVKLLCSLDSKGHIMLEFKGAKSDVFEDSVEPTNGEVVNIDSVIQPAYLLMNEPAKPAAAQPGTVNNLFGLESQISLEGCYAVSEIADIGGSLDVQTLNVDALCAAGQGYNQLPVDESQNAGYETEDPSDPNYQDKKAAKLAANRNVKYYVECELCNKPVVRRRILAHRRLVHKIGVYDVPCTLTCIYCPRRFAEPQQLQAHLKRHRGELLLVCMLCHKSFVDESIAQAHILHVHCADYRYSCGDCARGFWKKSTVQQHVCEPANRDINLHSRQVRAEKMGILQQLNRPLYTVVDPFADLSTYDDEFVKLCVLCKKSFPNRISYDLHSCTAQMSDYPHVCMVCSRHFAHEQQLQSHKCGSENTAVGVGPMYITVPMEDDVATVVGDDGVLFQDYESDDEQPFSYKPRNKEAVEAKKQAKLAQRAAESGNGKKRKWRKKVLGEVSSGANTLDDADADKTGDGEQSAAPVIKIEPTYSQPAASSPYGTRKLKISFIKLANGPSID